MVRFMSDADLLVADYSGESKSWKARMDKALEKTGLNIIPFPAETVNEKNEDGDYTAKGVYINFMQIGNYILFPQFGLNMDELKIVLESLQDASDKKEPEKIVHLLQSINECFLSGCI